MDRYLKLVEELDLRLVKAVDTHLHADHITGLGALRDRTRCITVMGEQSGVDVVSMRVADGDRLRIEGLCLDVIYTPGHTDDSYSYVLPDRVFSGDTLLIRGTGRTDFQNGDPRAQYESIFGKLLRLPEETMLVSPPTTTKATRSAPSARNGAAIHACRSNRSRNYAALMNGLNLPNPKMMDVAVPANMRQGLLQDDIARRGWAVLAEQVAMLLASGDAVLVDLREKPERARCPPIPGSLHAPYSDLAEHIEPGGMLHQLAAGDRRLLVFYCAYGERSAMAVQAAQEAGLTGARHVHGGIAGLGDRLMRLPRRVLLGGLLAAPTLATATLATATLATAASGPEEIALWPGHPPDGTGPAGPEKISDKGWRSPTSRSPA